MSIASKKDIMFVDTGCLRDHVSELRREKRIASQLHDNIRAMKWLCDPTTCDPMLMYRLDRLIRDTERLSAYFDKMADALERINDDAVALSRALNAMIVEDTERTNYIVSDTIKL